MHQHLSRSTMRTPVVAPEMDHRNKKVSPAAEPDERNAEAKPVAEDAQARSEVAPPHGMASDQKFWPNNEERAELEKTGSVYCVWERVSLCKVCQEKVTAVPQCEQCQKAVSTQWQQCAECQKKVAAAVLAVSACSQCRGRGKLAPIKQEEGTLGEEAESVALTKMSVSQCHQCQWHRVKDGTERMRTIMEEEAEKLEG